MARVTRRSVKPVIPAREEPAPQEPARQDPTAHEEPAHVEPAREVPTKANYTSAAPAKRILKKLQHAKKLVLADRMGKAVSNMYENAVHYEMRPLTHPGTHGKAAETFLRQMHNTSRLRKAMAEPQRYDDGAPSDVATEAMDVIDCMFDFMVRHNFHVSEGQQYEDVEDDESKLIDRMTKLDREGAFHEVPIDDLY